jgi:hypothetical protein
LRFERERASKRIGTTTQNSNRNRRMRRVATQSRTIPKGSRRTRLLRPLSRTKAIEVARSGGIFVAWRNSTDGGRSLEAGEEGWRRRSPNELETVEGRHPFCGPPVLARMSDESTRCFSMRCERPDEHTGRATRRGDYVTQASALQTVRYQNARSSSRTRQPVPHRET